MAQNTLYEWCINNARMELLNSWDYEANRSLLLDPQSVAPNSAKKAIWKCDRGHPPFPQVISKRTARGDGCPICSKEMKTSFPEQAIYFYIKLNFPDAINSDRHIGDELDIFIPSLKTAIEYDGIQWHKSASRVRKDTQKNKCCEQNGITMIRVRENGLPVLDCECIIRQNNQRVQDLENAIHTLLVKLGVNEPDVNLFRDGTKIRNQYISLVKENSLESLYPQIAKEWDKNQNGGITPDKVSAHSGDKYFWICDRGHSFYASVHHRTSSNHRGCPYCSGKKVLIGFNDLQTIRPDLAREWDYDNNEKTPNMFSVGSNKLVSWICPVCNMSYKSSIKTRKIGEGCPYCANKRIIAGKNDLETWCKSNGKEYLLKEWDDNKNLPLTPQKVSHGSDIKVHWICEIGHSYSSCLSNRTLLNRGCPICSGKVVAQGINDLSTTPNLIRFWNYTKNSIKPTEITAGSNNTTIWWHCPDCGNEWQESPNKMHYKKSKCSFCSGKRILEGFNDLATTHPQLALEWDYDKNHPLTPQKVGAGSHNNVHWICKKCGFTWKAKIENRAKNNTGCKRCYQSNRNLHAKKTPVINIDTGERFEAIKDACDKYGIHSANVIKCCKGQYKKTGGFRWKYAD